jgi:hippurate hydrolase
MLADGLFERFPCEAIFGTHNRPNLEVGRFAVKEGARSAGGAFFDVTIHGRGAHGARPEASVDPIVVVTTLTSAIQTIVARNVPPHESAVVSVTQIHGGDAYNVIPETARLGGTVRAFSREVMSLSEEALGRLARGVAEAHGAHAEVDFRLIFAPLVNDAEESEFAAEICDQVVGADHVDRNPQPSMASEDFSFMLERVPGCYINIGTGGPHDTIEGECQTHNPNYDFNDRALPYGASFFARLVETRLAST